jgi:hypothetical protein
MLVTVAIYAAIGALIVLAWYCGFHRYNRNKSIQVLRWIERAFAGHGRIVAVHWLSPSRFHAQLSLPRNVFQHAAVEVQLAPREFPFSWLLSRLRKDHELLTFLADLDYAPGFNLEVHNHRWCGRTRRNLPMDPASWQMERYTPFVITTRKDWQREVTTMINSLLASRDREFLSVSFRQDSPHFSASMAVQSIAPGASASNELFDVLRELSGGASASRL